MFVNAVNFHPHFIQTEFHLLLTDCIDLNWCHCTKSAIVTGKEYNLTGNEEQSFT